MENINYAKRSLEGLWVGDCVGNLGQLYFAHDILKALEAGLAKFGGQLDRFQKQFQYSDDTEEAIVLYNHFITNKGNIDQDKLAMEFATRYMERDPDGEIYGYGLNTRKVLRGIYDGIPWREANKIFVKSEGMPSHIDSLVNSLSQGKSYKDSMKEVNAILVKESISTPKVKQSSCGNGSAMRVAPLGAYLGTLRGIANKVSDAKLVADATLQAEVTHCHSEGIAGSIAITKLASLITRVETNQIPLDWVAYHNILRCVPDGQVKDGIEKASQLSLDTPIPKLIEVLGNGTHVTCQDTVPLCIFLTIKALMQYKVEEMYEKSIIETSMAFGDVDTNCAIVGGMIGIISPAPEKWVKFCQPMEGVYEPTKS